MYIYVELLDVFIVYILYLNEEYLFVKNVFIKEWEDLVFKRDMISILY